MTAGMCAAVSRPLLPSKPDSYMICTRDPDHKGSHSACDGQGHILAQWLRMPVERYYAGECATHDHGHRP